MGWVDRVPRAGNLCIGGLYALYQRQPISEAGITHVLSVIDFDLYEINSSTKFLQSRNYEHLVIQTDDDPNEDLLQHFRRMIAFIDHGLKSGGGVFVHCAMGKSRSATAVVAFLMWKYGTSREEALAQLCEGRPVCSPNPGFWEQLGVWERMLGVKEEEAEEVRQRWLKERFKGDWSEWEVRHARSKL